MHCLEKCAWSWPLEDAAQGQGRQVRNYLSSWTISFGQSFRRGTQLCRVQVGLKKDQFLCTCKVEDSAEHLSFLEHS